MASERDKQEKAMAFADAWYWRELAWAEYTDQPSAEHRIARDLADREYAKARNAYRELMAAPHD